MLPCYAWQKMGLSPCRQHGVNHPRDKNSASLNRQTHNPLSSGLFTNLHPSSFVQWSPVIIHGYGMNTYRYHYLGHKPLPGAQLRYFVTLDEQIIAALGFGAAAWQTAPRDQFIGWSHEQREKNLSLVVNNARFLIMPWVKSKNLASTILSMIARRLPTQWEERYGIRPVLLETFVDTEQFSGTCYKSANWIYVGKTKGRGKLGPAGKQSVPIKDLWLFPLSRQFRNHLTR